MPLLVDLFALDDGERGGKSSLLPKLIFPFTLPLALMSVVISSTLDNEEDDPSERLGVKCPFDVLALFEMVLVRVGDLTGDCAAVELTSFVLVGVDGALRLSPAAAATGTLLRVVFFLREGE